ncbi:MAG TPA: TOBE domain-containing protein [Ideonella sp.]|uniref:TOBE domain-containing protein n=1 Tax=Ideonella sp. TaxID=1929293 RepID=UPI002E351EEE|nr:TOBE domain-containing protein [Ideonella sp.]HEX5682844.1 TOBE domain-containing protein [Ideonella sp.]
MASIAPTSRRAEPRPARRHTTRLGLDGAVWLTVGGENLAGHTRVGLLRAVAEQGSITQAAKAFGISYKAAWDAIDQMNQMAGEPLVERSTGGRGGGSTRLTARGERLVQRYGQIDAAHQRFLRLLDQASIDLDQDFSLLSILNMKTSARNQFVGTVTSVRAGAVNDEIELTLPGGAKLVATVTRESTESLGLRTHMTAIALVKASSVLLATGLEGSKVSARNQLPGTVAAVTPGTVNAEVELEMDGANRIVAIVTQDSLKSLGLAPGTRATALFDASSVILAVAA